MDGSESDDFNGNYTLKRRDYEDIIARQKLYSRLWLESFTIIAALALIANILHIFVIAKFRKMRQNPTNVLLLNLNIIQMVFFIFSPMLCRAVIDFSDIIQWSLTLICILHTIHNVLIIAIMLFITLLLFDWYLKKYKELVYLKFINVYRFLVLSIYIFTILLVTIEIINCSNPNVIFSALIVPPLLFFLLFIMVIIFNIIHRVKVWRNGDDGKSSIGLVIANIFTVLLLPSIVSFIVASFVTFATIEMHFFVFFTIIIGLFSPPLNLLYLYRNDNEFHIFLRRVFRCSCNDYQNETFDDQPVTFTANGVHIP